MADDRNKTRNKIRRSNESRRCSFMSFDRGITREEVPFRIASFIVRSPLVFRDYPLRLVLVDGHVLLKFRNLAQSDLSAALPSRRG